MKRKILPALLVLTLLLSLLPTTVLAAGTDVTASGTCGDNLTWKLTEDGTLTISGEGEMEFWGHGFDLVPWLEYCEQINTVIIEDGVTSISGYSFGNCEYLTSITIPDSVTYIGDWAFFLCINLTSITIPVSVTLIPISAFQGCSGLTDVYYGGSEEQWAEVYVDVYDEFDHSGGYGFIVHYNYNSSDDGSDDTETIFEILTTITDKTYTIGSGGTAFIHCSGELADFTGVSMDSVSVAESNYDKAAGSTIVTFHNDYLDTLSVGEHKVTLNFTTGYATAALTILAKSTEETTTEETVATDETVSAEATSPQTGETADLALWYLILAVSATALVGMAVKRKLERAI